MTPLKSMRERYENDPVFHQIVDCIRHIIASGEVTPSEVREAVMYATIIEDLHRPRFVFASDPIETTKATTRATMRGDE